MAEHALKSDHQMTQCPCAWAHSCKRQRLEECGCCACTFRRTTLQEDGDFGAAKENLHQHIRHLVVAGQSEAAAAFADTFEAEVRSASELWAAGCTVMDADFARLSGSGGTEGEEEEEDEEAAWATACAAALPSGVLASVAEQAVAKARTARPSLDPHGCASALSHLPCAKCQDKCNQRWGGARLRGAAQAREGGEAGGEEGGEEVGEGGEHDVCILEEKTIEQRLEEKLAQAKRDQRYVELSSDEDDGGGERSARTHRSGHCSATEHAEVSTGTNIFMNVFPTPQTALLNSEPREVAQQHSELYSAGACGTCLRQLPLTLFAWSAGPPLS